ncbi:MAG: CoA transferase [Candidatus Aureabacteria bacterium]|nr:CoA transferase [Candidatus Auribacterota bacterium]NLW94601.1 CoA transferase [Chlamydiota bacterium]HOE27066.1 CoA transferase [bacterium]HQM52134.1 CoA transferase [bacterium]
MKPLERIRVLDFTRVLAGPFCTMILGDMGAEVVKIEQPGKGDDTRAFGPPFDRGESAYFLSVNRGKKSVTLDLKSAAGREVVRRLIARSDVLVENFRPGTLEKLGFGYDAVSKINPRLVYASVSGFGQTGPWASRPGYDLAVQGLGGIMSLTGDPDGPPCKTGVSQADLVAGLYAVQGILLALYARERTGRGQLVDVAMFDAQLSLLTFQAGIFFMTGVSPARIGNRHPTICPYETFRASDRWITVAVGNDRLWRTFCELLDLAEICTHPDYATNPDRVKNRDSLFPIIQEVIRERDSAHWLALFERHGIPSGPILSVRESLAQPQAAAREMVATVSHPSLGPLAQTGIPVKLSETPGAVETPPPRLGEHTAEILSSLGFTGDEIETMRASGTV